MGGGRSVLARIHRRTRLSFDVKAQDEGVSPRVCIRIAFDDPRLVANAGLMLPATLALHLGLGELVDRHLDLGGAPGRANTGDKLMTLVASALAGGDCIDDADVLRSGGTARLGCVQGALHPGHLPAQLPLGAREAAGPGEPGTAGPGLGRYPATGP